MKYSDELSRAMEYLGDHPNTIFLGQAVTSPGTAMTNTLNAVSKSKLREMPVAEEMQLGIAIGLALDGWVPICIFPRWNFLLLAFNQLVNHLDKIVDFSNGGYRPKVIIRTSIGSIKPLHPQSQHVGDFTDPVREMCKNIDVVRLKEPTDIFPAFELALERVDGKSTLLVEYGDYYHQK